MTKFTVEGDLDGDDAFIWFGKVHDGEVVGNIMIEDDRLDGWVVLDLDANNRVTSIEIVGVGTVIRNGVEGLIGKPHTESHERRGDPV